MSNETRSTLLDPITPQNAVLLLIDQQEGLLARVYEPEQMRGHLLGLARGAQLLGVPVIMTTALSAGTNGPVGSFLTKRYHIFVKSLYKPCERRRKKHSSPARLISAMCSRCAP